MKHYFCKFLLTCWAFTGLLLTLAVSDARCQTSSYSLTPVVSLGDPVPGAAGYFVNDFEPSGINNRGEVAFAADMSTGGEGVFIARKGKITQLARTGDPAPGGGVFGGGVLGPAQINDNGDVAFSFLLEPFSWPLGINGGVYRYSHAENSLQALVLPGITPVPGGGTFLGALYHASINNRGDVAFVGIVSTLNGIQIPPLGLGAGIWVSDKHGNITDVASPGHPAPGGSTFEFAQNPTINNRGDIVFGAHVAGEPYVFPSDPSFVIFTAENVYVRWGATGQIQSIAHHGEPAPGGDTWLLSFGGVANDQGQIAFTGVLMSSPDQQGVTLVKWEKPALPTIW